MIMNYAHRGFSREYPENTMMAFEKAVEAGADGIELDVQVTKDGKLVIIHDEKINRTSNGKGHVKDFTYEELLQYDFSGRFAGESGVNKIPLLREYCEFVHDQDILSNIELKNSIIDYKNLEQMVYDMVVEYGLKDKVMFSSFNHESMLRMKAIDPTVICGLLTESRLVNPGEYTKNLGMECYHPAAYGLDELRVKAIKEQGILINVWIGKESVNLEELIKLNIDGIITNDPDMIKKLLV